MEHAKLISVENDQIRRDPSPEKPVDLSVVIPISERYDDLREIYCQWAEAISENGYSYEFIFVLDGSDHEILQTLKDLKNERPEIKVITLRRRSRGILGRAAPAPRCRPRVSLHRTGTGLPAARWLCVRPTHPLPCGSPSPVE